MYMYINYSVYSLLFFWHTHKSLCISYVNFLVFIGVYVILWAFYGFMGFYGSITEDMLNRFYNSYFYMPMLILPFFTVQ